MSFSGAFEARLELTMSAENERLPTELGWTKQEQVVSLTDILKLTQIFADASSLITSDNGTSIAASTHAKRADLHARFDL